MFPFNLTEVFEIINIKKAKKKFSGASNFIETPNEIRESINKLSKCPKCHFLIFDNYWSPSLENHGLKICPTCGNKFEKSKKVYRKKATL